MAEDIPGAVRSRVAAAQRKHQVPSLTVGLARHGKPLCLESIGLADVQTGRAARPSIQYRIGSITKTFTAAVVLLLAERGLLDLDEPVDRYLPGTGVGRARLRQLLSHTGGVQREAPLPMWSTMLGPDRAGLLESLTRAETVGRPGSRWHYSNLGYAMLGQIAQRVTGTPCEDLVSSELLAPLGLTSTTWRPEPDRATGYRLDPYQQDVVHREPEMDQGAIGIAGQLWSTAEDLLIWGHVLLGGAPDVLPATVTTAMHTLQVMVEPDGWSQGWGLGLILDRRGGRVLSGHTGAMPGFLSALSMDRESGIVMTAFANVTRGIRLNDLCAELIDEALGQLPADQRAGSSSGPWSRSGSGLGVPAQGGPVEGVPARGFLIPDGFLLPGQAVSVPGVGVAGSGSESGSGSTGSAVQGPTVHVLPVQGLPAELSGVPGRWWSESEETVFSWQRGCLHAHLADRAETSGTTFDREGVDRYRAASGRLCGECLKIKRNEQGEVAELEWATYPYRRSPN